MESTGFPMENPKNEEDVTHNLPEDVVLHFLSFLELKEAIQTSILNRRWRYLYTKLPFLNFDYNQFLHLGDGRARAFKEFIDQVFALRDSNSDIQKFSFSCCDLDKPNGFSRSHLLEWISVVLTKNIQELYLNIPVVYPGFCLPHSLSTCNSMTKLELEITCDSPYPLILPDSISLPNLKTLILIHVWIEGYKAPSKIFSNCPVLESLTMIQCLFRQREVDITAPKLKHLAIKLLYYFGVDRNGCSITLCAPNLISFFWYDDMTNEYSIKNLPALVEAAIGLPPNAHLYLNDGVQIFGQRAVGYLKEFHNVKFLSLSNMFFDQLVSQDWGMTTTAPIQFSSLRGLRLRTMLSEDSVKTVTTLLAISPNIEFLWLHGVEVIHDTPRPWYQYWDEVTLIDRGNIESSWESVITFKNLLYHLKVVEIQGVRGRLNEMLFLRFLLKHAPNLEEMTILPSKDDWPNKMQRLRNFSKNLLNSPRAASSIAICFFT